MDSHVEHDDDGTLVIREGLNILTTNTFFDIMGRKQSKETIAKRVAKNTGKKRTPEQRKRMSDAQQKLSKKRVGTFTEEHKKNLSESHKGKPCCEKARIANSIRWMREGNPNWKGGVSFEPYCPKFTKKFRERVRMFFGYKCVECGEMQEEEKLSIHHVHYNKQVCCDNTPPIFVALCRECHAKTSHNREYWMKHFVDIIKILYEKLTL